jgi:monofunctional biosynthetic peptidoglycan transglycosylase
MSGDEEAGELPETEGPPIEDFDESVPTAEDTPPRGGLMRFLRGFGWSFVVLFYGSIAWVATYRFAPPPGTLLMLERSLEGDTIYQTWTPLEDISPNLVRAVIAGEDSRFCLHTGIDFEAVEEAIDERKNGKKQRGASTISQQTAKNAFLWNGGGWVRKGAEAWFTLVAETLWTKRRTIEIYLNIAEWGDGYFGAEAAARARFGKGANALTREEASLLAAVLPSPNKWHVSPPGPYVRGRAAMLRLRMEQVRAQGLDQCVLGSKKRR